MSRALVIINSNGDRQRIAAWAQRAPFGTRVEFKASKRTIPQNSRMWLFLTAVSTQLVWHGARYSPEEWKDYFMHIYRGEKWMPHEDGGMVPIGRSTSQLSKDEHSELTTVIEAFCARNGVDIGDAAEQAA